MDPRECILRGEVARDYPSKSELVAVVILHGDRRRGLAVERMIAVRNSPVGTPLAHKTGGWHVTGLARQPLAGTSALGVNVAVPSRRELEGSV
jgi:hypothetical protein